MLITNQLFVLFLPLLAAHIGLLPLLTIPALHFLTPTTTHHNHTRKQNLHRHAANTANAAAPSSWRSHRETEGKGGWGLREREDSRTRGGAARRGEDSGQVSR